MAYKTRQQKDLAQKHRLAEAQRNQYQYTFASTPAVAPKAKEENVDQFPKKELIRIVLLSFFILVVQIALRLTL